MAEKKRGARGAGTIRQRKDGRWEARFVVGVDPGTGKDIRRSIYAATQREARQKMTAAIRELDDGTYKNPCKMTVGQWLDVWTAEYLGNVKDNTLVSYQHKIEQRIKPAMGAVKLDALNPHTIQKFYNGLTAEGLAPKTVKNFHGILHKALQQAVKLGYIHSNPADVCTLPRIVKKDLKPLDEDQSKAFLDAIKGHRFEALFTVALFTGMREGELLGLLWDCIDFDHGRILVDKQLIVNRRDGNHYELAMTKNTKSRTITAAPWIMQVLRQHKAQQAAQRLKAGPCWEDGGFVFTTELGRHLAPTTVYKYFHKFAEAIGCPDARFHDLRHSYAVAALRAGDDPKTVQGNLGHATAAFTLDVYGHVTDQMKQASAERMEGYIKSVLGL